MLYVCFEKTVLFFWRRIHPRAESVRRGVMIVIAPFCEMVCEFLSRNVCRGVFKVDYDQLLVLICRKQQWRFTTGLNAQKIAILCLETPSVVEYMT